MKHASFQAIFPLVVLVGLFASGCSNTKDSAPSAQNRTTSGEEVADDMRLEDGVYPIAPTDETKVKGDRENVRTVELINIPVEGSQESAPALVRVMVQPLVRFQNVSHFDFKFEANECTEIGFQNSDELRAYTRDHVGSKLAVVVDNHVVSQHKIREALEMDKIRITCCTVGGGDHLHKHLKDLKLASSQAGGSQ